jgi:Kef-type K+ transport system membrane component KefB
VVIGNAGHVVVLSWLSFIGAFAGIVLTFQAGAEVDVPQLVREWKASVSIGLVSFFAPFAVVALVTYYALDWSRSCSRRLSPTSRPSPA